MITRINELKTLTKHTSCECKSRFDGKNVDVSVKNYMYMKKIMFGILLHAVVKTENI